MEERFLKAREDREAARAAVRSHTSDGSSQRQQFEDQVKTLETDALQNISTGKLDVAAERIVELRRIVQEASSTITLPAHELARVNGVLSNVEKELEAKRATSKPAKRFAFSSGAKAAKTVTKPTSDASVTAEKQDVSAVEANPKSHESSDRPQRDVYGDQRGTTLVIGPNKAAFVRGCTDCDILIVPINGSVFISNCNNCRVYVACHQLRIKDCHQMDVYVWCSSTPIIEMCNAMRFGPYNCWRGLLNSSLPGNVKYASHELWARAVGEMALIDGKQQVDSSSAAVSESDINVAVMENVRNAYRSVSDFQWLKKSGSPNWRVLAEEEFTFNDTTHTF